MWEVDGAGYCDFVKPEHPENAFFIGLGGRWTSTATNPGPLSQGDPTTLTWGFLRDGIDSTIAAGQCSGDVINEPLSASNLIAFMDGLFGAGPGGLDLTQRPWFATFEAVFTAWGELNGVEYLYEPADDGSPIGYGSSGSLGVRADLRIGGHSVDGAAGPNLLGCNFYPEVGDMIIDTDNPGFFGNPDTTGLRNVLSHEHGHGMAFEHSCPLNGTKLMEPYLSLEFDGPQEDDILAANRAYGDTLQSPANGGDNDSSGTAEPLTPVIDGAPARVTTISIDGTSDEDWFSVTAPGDMLIRVTVTPTGTTYLNGPQLGDGNCSAGTSFNALAESNLNVELLGTDGVTVLATAASGAAGVPERISNVPLSDGAGTYFVRVFSAGPDAAQMYDLSVRLITPTTNCSRTPVGPCLDAAEASIAYSEKSAGKEKMKLQLKKITTATEAMDFGDPVTGSTAVVMCVYNDLGNLVEEHGVNRAGMLCGTDPCWTAKGATGYGYKDTLNAADGISKLRFRAGDATKGKADARGNNNITKGQTALPTGIAAALAGSNTPTIQMVTSDGLCVGATMTSVKRDDGFEYEATKE